MFLGTTGQCVPDRGDSRRPAVCRELIIGRWPRVEPIGKTVATASG